MEAGTGIEGGEINGGRGKELREGKGMEVGERNGGRGKEWRGKGMD